MVSGNGMGHVYFRGPNGWEGRLRGSILEEVAGDVIDGLLQEEAVDLLAYQVGENQICVRSRHGEALIHQFKKDIHYKVSEVDPFGYPSFPKTITDEEALQYTYETQYPDAMNQLLQIFRSPRTGDLVISARRGYDLRSRFEVPEHKGSHGSLDREHMAIPLCTNLPLPDRPLRSVDVFPTILEALNIEVPEGIDGQSFYKGET